MSDSWWDGLGPIRRFENGKGGIVTVESIGTMYGRPALAALREIVAAEKKHDPLAPVTVLVPKEMATCSWST